MDEDAPVIPEQQPSQDQPVATEADPRAPVWRRRPVQLAAAAVIVAAGVGIGIAVGSSGADQISVHGTLTLNALQYGDNTNPGAVADGDACDGFGGSGDIRPGLLVTVNGPDGHSVGSALLQAGVMQDVGTVDGLQEGLCVMPFTVSVPDGLSQYAVAIPGRGSQLFTAAQLRAGVALTLTLGQ